VPTSVAELAKKVELLESEVDDLHRSVEALQEESAFYQRLLEESSSRPNLPRPKP
jgi:outer membrane murein-binding lipoprotein Lpp